MRRTRVKMIVILGLLISIGLVLHVVESLLPLSFFVPGAKIGLANIASLLGLIIFGFKAGLLILFARIIAGSLLGGTFLSFNFFMSLSGGTASFVLMSIIYLIFSDYFSLIGVSVIGAVFHNLGQIITASFIISNYGLIYYLPYLTLLAIPSGIGIGLIVQFTENYLPGKMVTVE
ncbi:MAG: Gx transporter family protein [Bacillota bacterium]